MLQISVQTEQELFEQMHFFDDPFSSSTRYVDTVSCERRRETPVLSDWSISEPDP